MKKKQSPKLANRFLRWFCKPELLEAIQGDLEEFFYKSDKSKLSRSLHYWHQVITIIRPFALKRWRLLHNNFMTLLRLNFVITFRAIKKNTVFTGINIFGLGIGIFSCLLILKYISQQLSYDKFHTDFENIYRITHTIEDSDKSLKKIATYSRVGAELSTGYPWVQEVCRIMPIKGNTIAEKEDRRFREDKVLGVDANFFKIFDFTFLLGTPERVLTQPRSIVITEKIYEKFFNKDENPIGKEIVIDGALGIWSSQGYQDRITYTVMGVIKDLPSNTHLEFDYLLSFSVYPDIERELNNWGEGFYTYLKLDGNDKKEQLASSLPDIVEKYWPDMNIALGLQEMQPIHLTSNRFGELKLNGNKKSLWLLLGVAVILLLIAGTNYINFTMAKAIGRQKEIGIRKVFSAKPAQLFGQLMTEAFILNGLSLFFALLLIPIANPYISSLMGFDLIKQTMSIEFISITILVFAVGIFLSGIYPAYYISRLSIIGSHSKSTRYPTVLLASRKLLVGFQFAVSLLVIGFSVILLSQMRFINEKELGMNLEKTVVANGPTVGVDSDSLKDAGLSRFRQAAINLSNIKDASLANFMPGKSIRGSANGYVRRVGTPKSNANSYFFTQVDHQFFTTLEISMVAGRAFDPISDIGREYVIINREAAFQLGFKDPNDAIGQQINYRRQSKPVIIGVVEDFHQYSFRSDFQPIIFEVADTPERYCYLKLENTNDLSQLVQLQEIWEEQFPGNPFDFFFLDEVYAKQYQEEECFIMIFGMFSILAVFIAALGVLGLAFFIAKSSVKEIGIRKTLGANIFEINKIVIKRLGLYVVFACVCSIPFVYYIADQWLNAYVFRISIEWWMLALPTILLLFIALIVVTGQSIKVFKLNPAETLRTE